ncbi:unnamed protein product [Pleuronectes platessa]|uniref:Uncharacterized protein n=1 Tax=Pleuronectes platessa TaxID=8262 RepID=A0A9N7UQE9_PLEPL|nr:unnamed protein product [Pleuronectes platessa]
MMWLCQVRIPEKTQMEKDARLYLSRLPPHLFPPLALDQAAKNQYTRSVSPVCEDTRWQHLISPSCERCERLSVTITPNLRNVQTRQMLCEKRLRVVAARVPKPLSSDRGLNSVWTRCRVSSDRQPTDTRRTARRHNNPPVINEDAFHLTC